MSPHTLRISLHVLVLESPKVSAKSIEPIVTQRFPGTLITRLQNIREAQKMINQTVFDLIVLSLDPLRQAHAKLLETLKRQAMSMPTVLLIDRGEEEKLHDLVPQLPSSWEILHSDAQSALIVERRILKAIENHQRHWELNHLQQAFQSSLIQYRNLFDEVPDLIFLCDRTGCLLDVNQTAERMFGLTKEKLLMKPIFETFGLEREKFDQLLRHAMDENHQIEDVEVEFRRPDRPVVYGLAHMIRWQSAPGRPMQFQGVIKDISPHKRLEQKLRQSEDNYKTLYEMARITSSSLRIEEVADKSLEMIHDCLHSDGTMLLLNRSYDQLNLLAARGIAPTLRTQLEKQPPAVIGQDLIGQWSISSGIHKLSPLEADQLPPALGNWVDSHPDCQLIAATLGRSNPTLPTSILLLLVNKVTTLNQELLTGLSKTLEMGLTNCLHYANSQEAETRYRELWDTAPTFFISCLKGGIIFEINHTAATALGYSIKELIGKPFTRIIAAEDQDLFLSHHQELIQTAQPQTYELRLIRKNGQPLIVSAQSEPLQDNNGLLIGEKSALNDITKDREMKARLRDYAENLERKVEERTLELQQTMTFLNGILEGSTEYAIVGLDQHGTLLHFNHGAQLLFGYHANQLVGRQNLGLLIDFENGRFSSLEEIFQEVENKEGVLVEELPMITRQKQHLTALLTMNRLKEPMANLYYVAIIRDITEQKELEELLKLYTNNLQQVIEEKSRELDRQHIQLIQSSKLATLGEMATGIAHELNQPLSGISTRAQLLIRLLENRPNVPPEQLIESQKQIVHLVERITKIINHMRIFARQDQHKHRPFSITQSIDGALSLIGEQLRIHAIEIHTKIPEDLPKVLGEPLQIEQVILNLISNARDAMDNRADQLSRENDQAHLDYHKQLWLRVWPHSSEELCLEIEDNGTGMSKETYDKIFQPFFTTKEVGRGTGLGLSISYGILSDHNGRMEATSELGRGTTFRVYLKIWDGRREMSMDQVGEELVL